MGVYQGYVEKAKRNSTMKNTKQTERSSISDNDMKDEIFQSINNISFGEVVITIHNSKIVQIEKKEKKRFT